jgi:3-oxoacyl-[acyl-carrier protein] reductase
MEDQTNKVALITGGSKGIGFGIAEALLKAGYKVAITSRNQESADEAEFAGTGCSGCGLQMGPA